ncbi:MAG: DUF5104 domain-containing protein [Oscillospiraceae bacterium]
MKKIINICLLVPMVFLFASCSSVNVKTEVSKNSEEILRCFDEEDSEGLKALFCEEIQNTHNLDKEIAEAMKFFEGEIISYNDNFNGNDGVSISDGEILEQHFAPVIQEIETDAGVSYQITFHYYTIYKEDKQKVGITFIVIQNNDTQGVYIVGDIVD